MANVLRLRECGARDASHTNQNARVHDVNQTFAKDTTRGDFFARRPAIG